MAVAHAKGIAATMLSKTSSITAIINTASICLAFLFVGCKVGPDYQAPSAQMRTHWSMSEHPRGQGEPAQLGHWWIHFNDAILHELVQTTLNENLTLREAGQRILEARARRDVVAGNLYPQVQTANGGYGISKLSTNAANFFTFPGIFTANTRPEIWSAGLAASWELDFWGKYRRAIEASDANVDATAATYDEVRILMAAEVAKTYIEFRTAENRLVLTKQNLDLQVKTLELTKQRLEAGVATGLDVAQAETNVGQTSAIIPDLEILVRQANHRLSILLARPPEQLLMASDNFTDIPSPPAALALGIPADLLRRRPDVRRAERNLAAQSAKIGIAEAEFYPHVSLTGNIGFASEHASELFSSASTVGLINPGFSWNLFNYGRIKNNVRAEKAAFEALLLDYRSTVLNAAREAEMHR